MPTMAFCRSMRTSAVFLGSRWSSATVPLCKNTLKSRVASISLDLEYEDALDFVKSRSRRTAAGTLDAPVGGLSGCGREALCRSRLRSSDYDGGRGAKRVFDRRALQLLS